MPQIPNYNSMELVLHSLFPTSTYTRDPIDEMGINFPEKINEKVSESEKGSSPMSRITGHNRRASRMVRKTETRREGLSQNVLKNLAPYGYPPRRSRWWFQYGSATGKPSWKSFRWRWCWGGLSMCSHFSICCERWRFEVFGM
ncbi:unnamed protein product [Camellia sinensis]